MNPVRYIRQRARTPDARDDSIIQLYVVGRNVTEIAAQLGVSQATIYRRFRDPLFQAKVHEARAEQLKPALDYATSMVGKSIETIEQLSNDKSVHASTRVRAAVALVEITLRLRQEVYVAARLAAIEAALAEYGIESPVFLPTANDLPPSPPADLPPDPIPDVASLPPASPEQDG